MPKRRIKKIVRVIYQSLGPLPARMSAQFADCLLVFSDASQKRQGGLAAVIFADPAGEPLVRTSSVPLMGSNKLELLAALFALQEAQQHFPGRTYKGEILDFKLNNSIPYLKDEFDSENFNLLKDGDLVLADASEDYNGVGESIEGINVGNKKVIGGLHTVVLRGINNFTANGYNTYLFRNPIVHKELKKIATGISVYGFSKGNLVKLKIPLPPLREQKAIATLLSTWDDAIHKTEQLITQRELRKKWLMQQLLTGKKRLKEFEKSIGYHKTDPSPSANAAAIPTMRTVTHHGSSRCAASA